MKHQENCQLQICIDGEHRHPHMPCTCIPIESPEEKCDCPTKYCKHFESDFDKYCKENPHCDECAKAMEKECKAPCEEEKGGWEEKLSIEVASILDIQYGDTRDNPKWKDEVTKSATRILSRIIRSELATAREEERKEIIKLLDWRNRPEGEIFNDGDDIVDWYIEKIKLLALGLETR